MCSFDDLHSSLASRILLYVGQMSAPLALLVSRISEYSFFETELSSKTHKASSGVNFLIILVSLVYKIFCNFVGRVGLFETFLKNGT